MLDDAKAKALKWNFMFEICNFWSPFCDPRRQLVSSHIQHLLFKVNAVIYIKAFIQKAFTETQLRFFLMATMIHIRLWPAVEAYGWVWLPRASGWSVWLQTPRHWHNLCPSTSAADHTPADWCPIMSRPKTELDLLSCFHLRARWSTERWCHQQGELSVCTAQINHHH